MNERRAAGADVPLTDDLEAVPSGHGRGDLDRVGRSASMSGSETAPTTSTAAPAPHAFWQTLLPPGTLPRGPAVTYRDAYPAVLPDGRQLPLPIRERDGGRTGLASLILNQSSFAVQDALADALAERLAPYEPDVVVGVPTLGLPLAEQVARRLGHPRFVAFGTSRKFWYDEALSRPLTSVTSPDQTKRLYLDPRMRPLLRERRVALVDDVISTGRSIAAALQLLTLVDTVPAVIGCAMLQGSHWPEEPMATSGPGGNPMIGVLGTPTLERVDRDRWRAAGTPDRPDGAR